MPFLGALRLLKRTGSLQGLLTSSSRCLRLPRAGRPCWPQSQKALPLSAVFYKRQVCRPLSSSPAFSFQGLTHELRLTRAALLLQGRTASLQAAAPAFAPVLRLLWHFWPSPFRLEQQAKGRTLPLQTGCQTLDRPFPPAPTCHSCLSSLKHPLCV